MRMWTGDEDVGCFCCGAGDPRGEGWGLSGDLLVGNGELPCLCLCCACAVLVLGSAEG